MEPNKIISLELRYDREMWEVANGHSGRPWRQSRSIMDWLAGLHRFTVPGVERKGGLGLAWWSSPHGQSARAPGQWRKKLSGKFVKTINLQQISIADGAFLRAAAMALLWPEPSPRNRPADARTRNCEQIDVKENGYVLLVGTIEVYWLCRLFCTIEGPAEEGASARAIVSHVLADRLLDIISAGLFGWRWLFLNWKRKLNHWMVIEISGKE